IWYTIVIFFIQPAFWCNIGFASNYWFYTLFHSSLIELNYPKHISMVCNCQCRHLVSVCCVYDCLNSICPIEEAVFCMKMEVDKIRMLHNYPSILYNVAGWHFYRIYQQYIDFILWILYNLSASLSIEDLFHIQIESEP